MHDADLAGLRHRTEEHLPGELWEIAQTLQQYSRLAATEIDGGDDAAAGLRAAERKALAEVFAAAAERRVEALELYARRAGEADRHVATLAAVEQLEARGEQILDLLARTAAADIAATGTRTLADRAAAAGQALAQARQRGQGRRHRRPPGTRRSSLTASRRFASGRCSRF